MTESPASSSHKGIDKPHDREKADRGQREDSRRHRNSNNGAANKPIFGDVMDVKADKLMLILKILTLVFGIVCVALAGSAFFQDYTKDEFFLAWACIALITSAVLFLFIFLKLLDDYNPKKIDGIFHLVIGIVYVIAYIIFAIAVSDLWNINVCRFTPGSDLSCSNKRGERVSALVFGIINSILYLVIGLIQLGILKVK